MAIFGMGKLAGFKVAATRSKGPAGLLKTFADDVKSRAVMHVVQDVDKFHQENSGTLDTPVIEMVLRRCTKAGPPDTVRRKYKLMKKAALLIMVAALMVGGCAGANQNTATRTLSGGAVGAGAGSLIGWAAGCPACGAAIGGATGLATGYIYDQYEKSHGGY
jgi:osmotically inducible lipoprotein OsmB